MNPQSFLHSVLLACALVSPAAAQIGPTITKQPAGLSRSLGDKASLSVTATGDAPLAYQWRHDGSPVANATNRTLTLTNLTTALAGTYLVVVSNAVNAGTSLWGRSLWGRSSPLTQFLPYGRVLPRPKELETWIPPSPMNPGRDRRPRHLQSHRSPRFIAG